MKSRKTVSTGCAPSLACLLTSQTEAVLCMLSLKQSKASFAGVSPTHRASGVMVSTVLYSLLLRQERGERGRIEMEQR